MPKLRYLRNGVLGLTVLLAAFFTGVSSSLVVKYTTKTLTLCELYENRKDYLDQTVLVEGQADSTYIISLNEPNCPDTPSLDVLPKQDYKPLRNAQMFFSDSPTEIRRGRVKITGVFVKTPYLCLLCSEYQIQATHVEVLSEITSEPLPNFDSEGLLLKPV